MSNMCHNIPALISLIQFMYENIQYAEMNTKSDYCQVCGYDGEILIDDNLENLIKLKDGKIIQWIW